MTVDPYVPPAARLPLEPRSRLAPWQMLVLLPVLAWVLDRAHHVVQATAIGIGTMPVARNAELAALMLSSLLGPAVTAALFAYPIARLYAQRSALAAAVIIAPTLFLRIADHLGEPHLPWTNAILVTQWVSLAVLVPLAAALVHRGLARATR